MVLGSETSCKLNFVMQHECTMILVLNYYALLVLKTALVFICMVPVKLQEFKQTNKRLAQQDTLADHRSHSSQWHSASSSWSCSFSFPKSHMELSCFQAQICYFIAITSHEADIVKTFHSPAASALCSYTSSNNSPIWPLVNRRLDFSCHFVIN